jgi:outer membrane autotransporter protein
MKVLHRNIFARLAKLPGLAAGLLALAAVSGHAQAVLPTTVPVVTLLHSFNPALTLAATTPTVNRFLLFPYTYNEVQVAGPLARIIVADPTSPLATNIFRAALADIATGTPAATAAGTPNFSITNVPRALDSLSANQYTMLRFVEFKGTENFFNNIDAHLAAIRLGTQGFSTTTYTQPAPTTGYTKEGKEAKAPVAPPPPAAEPKFSVWVNGIGNIGTLDTGGGAGIDHTADDFDFYGGGVIGGFDYKICPKVAIGLAAGYEYTHISPKEVLGSAHTQQVNGEFYATYGGPVGLYVNGIVGGGYSWNDVHREVFGTQAFSSPQAADFNTHGELGYQIRISDNLGITPFGQLSYDHLWNSGADEKGSIANLDIHHGTADSFRSVVGGKLILLCNLFGLRLTNTLWAGWEHEFLKPYYSVNASFQGFETLGTFETRGARFGHESFTGGAGVSFDLITNVSVTFNYDVQANDSFMDHFFNLGLGYRF